MLTALESVSYTHLIDMIIDGGSVGIGLESTIVDFTEEIPTILRPGYVNEEMLEKILGEVRMDQGLLTDDMDIHPKAPGMKSVSYTHLVRPSISGMVMSRRIRSGWQDAFWSTSRPL